MRRLPTLLAIALWAADFAVANAAYVIKLKNGNEYITARYWQEGTQILFDAEGGIFGIDKAFVSKIEKTDKVIRVANVVVGDPAQKPKSDATESSKESPAPQAKAETIKKRAPDDPIVAEFNSLNDRSKQLGGMLTEEIRELLNAITSFKNKILKDAKLFIEYGREFNDLQSLGAAAETELKNRSQ